MKNNKNTSDKLQIKIDRLKVQLGRETAGRCQAEEQVEILTEKLNTLDNAVCSFETNIEDRIRFDVLLSEISSHFINLPPDQVDDAISEAQGRVCECLGLDLSAVWQWEVDNPDELIQTHDRKSTRMNSSHVALSRMPSSA